MDGFSPNLNKFNHVGGLSNLIIAKALQSLQVANKTIALLGDTLPATTVKKKDALTAYKQMCVDFDYNLNKIYFASKQILKNDTLLIPGTDKYIGSFVFKQTNRQYSKQLI